MKALLLFLLCHFPHLVSAQATARPFVEYEPVKYLVMSAGFEYQTLPVKRKILQHLPPGVTVLVYALTAEEWKTFSRLTADLGPLPLEPVIIVDTGETTWPRDNMPFPVWENNKWHLVDAPYYEGYDPDLPIAAHFGLELKRHHYYFEHGNLVSNRRGECFVVQEIFATQAPDSLFLDSYGCQTLTRLPYLPGMGHGIGHVDEMLKFMSDDLVLTSQPELVKSLEGAGYRVLLLPQAKLPPELAKRGVMPQRSYVNSLLLNDTVFVPTFGLETDEAALDIYRSLGLKVVGVDSAYVADYGGGALHCLTATYPDFNASQP